LAKSAAVAGDDLEITLGAFNGVWDSSAPGEARTTRLFESINMFIPNAREGSEVLQRHGCLGLATQLGNSAGRTGQGVLTHRRLDGTIDRFTFGGGRMYRWDGAAGFTDITPVGIVIDAENPVFVASMNDEIIISDETNPLWIYTLTTGAAEIIWTDDAHTDYSSKGGPVIKSGKVVFILRRRGSSTLTEEDDTDLLMEDDEPITTELTSGFQNTILWSEEADPRTGYQQGDFDNALTLIQTSDEVLAALSAEEGALVYMRNTGIGFITGDITEDFKASNTKDTISSSRGTDAPAAVFSKDRKIWFVDMDGRVCRASVGGGEPEQLYFPIRREVEDHVGAAANRADVARYARVGFHEAYNLMLFTIWDRRTVYGFDADTGRFMSEWVLGGDVGASAHIDAMGSMLDANNRATFVFLGTRGETYSVAEQGVFWRQKHSDDDSQWLDQANASSGACVALTRAAETQWVTSNAAAIYRVHQIAAQLVGDTNRHQIGLQYTSPAAGISSQLVARSTRTVGVKSAADAVATARWSLGPNAQGGALRFRIAAANTDNVRFGLHNILVTGTVVKARPGQR
jgi:hypothetical protein